MRKLAYIIMAVLFISCGSSEVVREARKTINGDWTLNSITYQEDVAGVQIELLEDSYAECFRGSTWNFISNNNTGSYILQGPACDTSTRFFIWSVEQSGTADTYDLLLKPTDSDFKSTTGNQGFRLNLVTLTPGEMVWEQTITFEGSPFTIQMNFNKN